MKASIIITNYNKSSYLEKCINSCLRQKYKNIEIILFDDCSKDDSNKIYDKFKKKIKIIENKKKKFTSFSQNQTFGIHKSFLISKSRKMRKIMGIIKHDTTIISIRNLGNEVKKDILNCEKITLLL